MAEDVSLVSSVVAISIGTNGAGDSALSGAAAGSGT